MNGPGDRGLWLEPMKLYHLTEVMAIERQCYPNPWSLHLFIYEVRDNRDSRYYVLREQGRVAGYGGVWVKPGEAHITNLAVDESCRRQRYGTILLEFLIRAGRELGARVISLEVRESNYAARKMYEGRGFANTGRRFKYYGLEDAITMALIL